MSETRAFMLKVLTMLTVLFSLLSTCWAVAESAGDKPFIPDANTVLLVHGDEGQGTPADSSATKATVDMQGVRWQKEGVFGGNAMAFSGGKASYLNCTGDPLNLTGSKLTVEAWVKQTDQAAGYDYQQFVVAQDNGAGVGLLLRNGCLGFWVNTSKASSAYIAPSEATRIPRGVWTHIAGTYDGIAVRVFIDGKMKGLLVVNGGDIAPYRGIITIGSRTDLANAQASVACCFVGLINEVRVSNTVRYFPPASLIQEEPLAVDAHTTFLLHCNEGQGSPLDSSAGKATVTLHNADWSNDGKFGSAMALHGGADSYLKCAGSGVNVGGAGLTVEAWVKQADQMAGFNNEQYLVAQSNGSGYVLGVHGGCLYFYVNTEEGRFVGIDPSETTRIPKDYWTHVAGTYDGKTVRILINGEEKVAKMVNGGALVPGGETCYIGNRGDLVDNPQWKVASCFVGLIDEMRISNVARYLPKTAVKAPGGFDPDAHTALLLHFDEGEGKPLDAADGHAKVDVKHVEWSKDGKYGGAMTFQGGQFSYLRCTGASLGIAGNALTVEAWVKQTDQNVGDFNAEQQIIAQTNMGGYQLKAVGGNLAFYVNTEEEHYIGIDPSPATHIPANSWTHVAGTYDGTAVRLFINEQQVASKQIAGGPLVAEGGYCLIGYRGDLADSPQWGAKCCFVGQIDEVRISNSVRYHGEDAGVPAASDVLTVGKSYYVSQAANAADTNPGTRGAPFATIGKAAALAQAGDRVLIGAGTYREAVTVANSGTAEHPITFAAETLGTVIISGADVVNAWQHAAGTTDPAYCVAWPHAPVFKANPASLLDCGEVVVYNGQALEQVWTRAELKPGTFRIDYAGKLLTLWLPGGTDPNAGVIEVTTRGSLFTAASRDVKYVTVQGLTLRYGGSIVTSMKNGWRMEDCVVSWCRDGVAVDGNDVTLLRVSALDSGGNGMAGEGNRILVKDCVLLRNNRRGENPSDTTGGCKFLNTNGLHVENLLSAYNTGEGIWLDYRNRNYSITGCTIYGNHGLTYDWEGLGVMVEISEGPGVIAHNTIYSNTGGGVGLCESANVEVRDNMLVDNKSGVEFRDMDNRGTYHLGNITIAGNTIKAWRGAAISTSLGQWHDTSAAEKKLTIDGNTYDPAPDKPFYLWAGLPVASIETARAQLGVEKNGIVQAVTFAPVLIASKTRLQIQEITIPSVLGQAQVGDIVAIPVFARGDLTRIPAGWRCQIYDLKNNTVTLTLTTEEAQQALTGIPAYPLSLPTYVKVKLTNVSTGLLAGEVVMPAK